MSPLVAAAVVPAALDWWAVARRRAGLEYVCKPLTMLVLIAAAASLRPDADPHLWRFMVAGLVLSLVGDVFLMLPNDRFVPGLASFLVAHVAYAVAFGAFLPGWATLMFALGIALASVLLWRRVRAGLARAGSKELVVPVFAYVVAISVMATFAWSTVLSDELPGDVAAALAAGASLFYASDALIGWERFVRPRRWAPLAIIVTYHLGQIVLVLGLASSA